MMTKITATYRNPSYRHKNQKPCRCVSSCKCFSTASLATVRHTNELEHTDFSKYCHCVLAFDSGHPKRFWPVQFGWCCAFYITFVPIRVSEENTFICSFFQAAIICKHARYRRSMSGVNVFSSAYQLKAETINTRCDFFYSCIQPVVQVGNVTTRPTLC